MQLRKYRWSKDYESAEEALIDLLAQLKITANRWVADMGQSFDAQTLTTPRRLWCAEGSIVFTVNGQRFSLQTGDALDIPANTPHHAQTGLSGCACYEAVILDA